MRFVSRDHLESREKTERSIRDDCEKHHRTISEIKSLNPNP